MNDFIQYHKDRISTIFLKHGELSSHNDSLLFVTSEGEKVYIPVNQFTNICLEPGTTVTHGAVALCSEHNCMLNWVGENAVRLYSSGSFSSSRSERVWHQASMALNKTKRLSISRKMYEYRFSIEKLGAYSIQQLSGIEGSKIKELYQKLADEFGIEWSGRNFIIGNFDKSDLVNKCISTANSCIYGLCHCAILSAGYSPAIGFIHGKTALSFVYDVADLFKFRTITRIAFSVAANSTITNHTTEVRYRCRDFFHESNFMNHIIPIIDTLLGFNKCAEPDPILYPQDFQTYADSINRKNSTEL